MAVEAIYSIERQLKPEDDAVTRAEVNTLSVVIGEICSALAVSARPAMQYKSEVSTGESLCVPSRVCRDGIPSDPKWSEAEDT